MLCHIADVMGIICITRAKSFSHPAGCAATLLVVIYVAFSFTELVRFPHNKDYLEIYGFFTFLYFTATLYLIYILTYVVKQDEGSPRAVDNFKVNRNNS